MPAICRRPTDRSCSPPAATPRLRGLANGGDVRSVVSAGVPADAWDRKAVNPKLGGLTELHVAEGGRIEGEAGTVLTVARLRNEGPLRLPGGTIRQDQILPIGKAHV